MHSEIQIQSRNCKVTVTRVSCTKRSSPFLRETRVTVTRSSGLLLSPFSFYLEFVIYQKYFLAFFPCKLMIIRHCFIFNGSILVVSKWPNSLNYAANRLILRWWDCWQSTVHIRLSSGRLIKIVILLLNNCQRKMFYQILTFVQCAYSNQGHRNKFFVNLPVAFACWKKIKIITNVLIV